MRERLSDEVGNALQNRAEDAVEVRKDVVSVKDIRLVWLAVDVAYHRAARRRDVHGELKAEPRAFADAELH